MWSKCRGVTWGSHILHGCHILNLKEATCLLLPLSSDNVFDPWYYVFSLILHTCGVFSVTSQDHPISCHGFCYLLPCLKDFLAGFLSSPFPPTPWLELKTLLMEAEGRKVLTLWDLCTLRSQSQAVISEVYLLWSCGICMFYKAVTGQIPGVLRWRYWEGQPSLLRHRKSKRPFDFPQSFSKVTLLQSPLARRAEPCGSCAPILSQCC